VGWHASCCRCPIVTPSPLTTFGSAITLLLLALPLACASSSPPPRAPRAFFDSTPAPASPPAPPDPVATSNVVIAEDIRKACGLSEGEAFFEYNSSQIRGSDKLILQRIAECFIAGPLKDQEMRLVGRTDPRGDEEYNYALGHRRADNVKGTLLGFGMRGERVSTTSRGENDATGIDDTGWATDRRVDMLLGSDNKQAQGGSI